MFSRPNTAQRAGLGALLLVFASAAPAQPQLTLADAVTAAASGLAYFGLAGEIGAENAKGPGSFMIASLDALYNIDEKALEQRARIQTG